MSLATDRAVAVVCEAVAEDPSILSELYALALESEIHGNQRHGLMTVGEWDIVKHFIGSLWHEHEALVLTIEKRKRRSA